MRIDLTCSYSYIDLGRGYVDNFYIHDRECYFPLFISDVVNTNVKQRDFSDMFSSMRIELDAKQAMDVTS